MFANLTTEELLCKLEELGDRVPMELIQEILSRDKEVVQPLSKVLQDKQYWEASDDKLWMPVHAVKLLGTLANPDALPQLIDSLVLASEADYDWVMEDLPTVFGRIGSPAVEPLIEFILKNRGDDKLWWSRTVAANGLVAIAIQHPQERERVLSLLHGLFSEGEDPEFLGFAASYLLDLNDSSSIPILEKAFDLDLIEEDIVSREDLQQDREEPDKETLAQYNSDLLEFYEPQQVAERQARWEEERREEELLAAQKREKLEKSIDSELKRLDIAMKWSSPKALSAQRKIGRNEPCPCGSGKKFKKCCLQLVEVIPLKQVLGGGYYVTSDHLKRVNPFDPILVLENLTALAFEAEKEDVTRAMDIFRKLEPLAERSGMLGDFLNHRGKICYNHPELGEDGLAVLRRRQSFYQDKDREQWADASMDAADYLCLLGRWDEGRKEYETLLDKMPDFPMIHIRFARFLEKGGLIDDAVHQYQQILKMENQVEEYYLEMAAEELKELASRLSLKLDPSIQEIVERLNSNSEEENTFDEFA